MGQQVPLRSSSSIHSGSEPVELVEWVLLRTDVLPVSELSVSKNSREHITLTQSGALASSFLHPPLTYNDNSTGAFMLAL